MTNNHKGIHWTVHVDNNHKAMCEITYEKQKLFLPLELMGEFASKMQIWHEAIFPQTAVEITNHNPEKIVVDVLLKDVTDGKKSVNQAREELGYPPDQGWYR